jgi:uncharacterized membrane protein
MIAQADFAAFMKERYPEPSDVQNLAKKNQPFFEMVDREETQGGQDLKIPIVIGTNSRRSCTFSVAQNGADNASYSYQAFKMTVAQDFCLASWSAKLLKVSDGDANSLAQVVDSEMIRSVQALERSYGIKLFRTGTGSVCQFDSTVTGGQSTVKLFPKGSAQHIELGDGLQVSATDGSVLLGSSAVGYVIGVDRSADTVTLSATAGGVAATINTISGSTWLANHFVYKQGDAANAGANIACEGVLSFVPPTTANLGTAFYGVTRSADPVRLAGDRIDNTSLSLPLDEILVYAITQAEINGATVDAVFLHPYQMRDLINRMSAKIVRSDQKNGKIGFSNVSLLSDSGKEVPLYSDINCDYRYGIVTQMDSWKLISAGPAIHVDNFDGNEFLRTGSASGYEMRLQGYSQLTNRAPGWTTLVIF